MEDTKRTRPTASTKQDSHGLIETETTWGLHASTLGCLQVCCNCYLGVLVRWLTVLVVVSDSSSFSWDFLPHLWLPGSAWCEGFPLVFLYLIFSCLAVISWSFLKSKQEMDQGYREDNEKLDEWKKREKLWFDCIVEEKNLFSIKK